MTYVITGACIDVKDKGCIEECPVDCIYEAEHMLYIHPDECVDCGACEPVCPVEAIFYEDDVPEQWKEYNKINSDFFADLGSPGGASKIGFVLPDKTIATVRKPPLYSPSKLPDVKYNGMVREFAGMESPLPGTIALIDQTTDSGSGGWGAWDSSLDKLINLTLLFHDRVIVLCDRAENYRLVGPVRQLRDAGMVDFSAADAWIVEVAGSLLESCDVFSSGRQVSEWDAWLLAKDRGSSPLFSRLWISAEHLGFRTGPRRWDKKTYGLARSLLPQVIQYAARQRGITIDCIKGRRSVSFFEGIPSQINAQRGVSDFERVSCEIFPMSPEDVRTFRAEHRELFHAHMALVRQSLRESASTHPVERDYDTLEALDALAESSYRLYTATRGLPHADHGSWSIGSVCGSVLSSALPDNPSDAAGRPVTDFFNWILQPARLPRW